MKKNFLNIIAVASVMFISASFTSCKNWLDINENPYKANDVDPDYLFNYAAVAGSGIRTGGDFYVGLTIGAQTTAGGGSGDDGGVWSDSNYEFSTYMTGNTWKGLYSTQGNQLSIAANMSIQKGRNNAAAQCKIALAHSLYMATTLYGDVPMSQAFQIEKFPKPVYDPQKNVLEGCLALLDEASTFIDPAAAGAIKKYDIFYAGDMNKWVKLANSLKLQILLVMYNKVPDVATKISAIVAEDNFISSADENWAMPYFTVAGTQNPQFRLNDENADIHHYCMFFAHESVVTPMNTNNDPRRTVYFTKETTTDSYVGLKASDDAIRKKDQNNEYIPDSYNCSVINFPVVWAADQPDMRFSYSEQLFNLAEIYALGIGVTKNITTAQTHFNNAVTEACKYWGIKTTEITTFVGGLPQLTDANCAEVINTQRWIDFMTRPLEAFTNYRRTLIPTLAPPTGSVYGETSLFHRFEYADEERASNPNVPSPFPTFVTKMWFEK